MRVSLNWLNEYVDIKNENKNELADKLTKCGIAVETIEKICNATNLTVGKVIERKDHPSSDHLNVCKVDLGNDEIVQIVCGANNVIDGIKVIVSKVGALLPGGIEIKKTIIRGKESNGMICALNELGLPDEGEVVGGIHVLPDEAIIGSDPLTYLGYDDVVFSLDLNPNRHDCTCILGMAYETAAVLNKDVKIAPFKLEEEKEKTSDLVSIKSTTDNCKLYMTKIVKNIKIQESPDFIKSRLIASGLRPINNVIDISNYVMLEYNQPLHFYDYDKVGMNINIRMANNNEETTTLDNKKLILSEEDIVITNNKEVIAIAGVMGCHNSEITEHTQNVLIESAIFNPKNIRLTSIKNNLRSEASLRFEKGLDPNMTEEALNKAAYLLQKYASGSPLNGNVIYDEYNKQEKNIEVSLIKINEVLGMTLTNNDVIDVFNKLKFKIVQKNNTFIVTVPTRRLDITIKEDLIEEIGRIYGYDNIKAILPIGKTKEGTYTNKSKYIKKIKHKLLSLGFLETKTYSLVNDKEVYQFTNKDFKPIKLLAPLSEEKSNMRYSIIPSLINVVDYNLARNIKDIIICEASATHYEKNEEHCEEQKVAGALLGNYLINNWQNKKIEIDFYLVKGMVENLLNFLGLNGRYIFEKTDDIPKEYHPGRSASIKIDNVIVGYIGNVHPSIHKSPIVVFELSIDKLFDLKLREIKYKEVSKYPTVSRDFAILVDKNINASDIIKTIKKTGGKILSNILIFDLYTGPNIDDNKKSIAFNLIFQDPNKTLIDEEITFLFNTIIESTVENHNAILRSK